MFVGYGHLKHESPFNLRGLSRMNATTVANSEVESVASTPAAVPDTAANRRYAVLAMLTLAYVFNFLDRQLLSVVAAPIKAELNLTDGDLGKLGGVWFAAVYCFLGIPAAWLADRSSRTWIMTFALTIWSGFTAACGTASSYLTLGLFRMGVGVGEAGGVAPSYSVISDYFPKEQRARALAFYSFGIPIGMAIGYFGGSWIATRFNWRTAFIVLGLAGLAFAPLFRWVVKEPPRAAPAAGTAAPSFVGTFQLLLGKPSFWLLSFGAAAASMCGYGIAFWLPQFFIRSMGLSQLDMGAYVGAMVLFGGVPGIWAGGWVADRLGKMSKRYYPLIPATAFLISLPVFLVGMNMTSLTVAFGFFLVPQALNLVWLGPVLTSVQHLVPATMRSTASAAFLLINNFVGIAAGTFFIGKASDLFLPIYGSESVRYAIYAALVFYLVSASLFFFASRRLERDWVA